MRTTKEQVNGDSYLRFSLKANILLLFDTNTQKLITILTEVLNNLTGNKRTREEKQRREQKNRRQTRDERREMG